MQHFVHLSRSVRGADHAHHHVVERPAVLLARLVQRPSGLDPFDQEVEDDLLPDVRGLSADGDQPLHQGQAGFDRGRELPHEVGEFDRGDRGTTLRIGDDGRLLRGLDDLRRLSAEGADPIDGAGTRRGRHGPGHLLAVFIDSLICECRHGRSSPEIVDVLGGPKDLLRRAESIDRLADAVFAHGHEVLAEHVPKVHE